MNNTLLDTVAACSKDLMKFGFSVEEFATLVQENNMTDAEVLAVAKVFEHLRPGVKFCVSDFRQSQEWHWKAGRILAWIPW